MKKISILIVAAMMVFLSGCVCSEIDKNLDNSQKLRCGMSKEQVVSIMGEPLNNQKFADENHWYYRDQIRCFDGQCTADECMVLVFENDKLAGWGREFNARRNFIEPKK